VTSEDTPPSSPLPFFSFSSVLVISQSRTSVPPRHRLLSVAFSTTTYGVLYVVIPARPLASVARALTGKEVARGAMATRQASVEKVAIFLFLWP
jgi:hypothetical protein